MASCVAADAASIFSHHYPGLAPRANFIPPLRGWFGRTAHYISFRRSIAPNPKTPEANSRMLLGSGTLVVVLVLLVPRMLNDSAGISG